MGRPYDKEGLRVLRRARLDRAKQRLAVVTAARWHAAAAVESAERERVAGQRRLDEARRVWSVAEAGRVVRLAELATNQEHLGALSRRCAALREAERVAQVALAEAEQWTNAAREGVMRAEAEWRAVEEDFQAWERASMRLAEAAAEQDTLEQRLVDKSWVERGASR